MQPDANPVWDRLAEISECEAAMKRNARTKEPWWNPAQKNAARNWLEKSLAERAISLKGELLDVQIRPWSVVLKAPSIDGDVYFKASSPSLAHEAPLTDWLADRHPELVPEVLAAEPEQGWLILRDGGVRLRDSLDRGTLLSVWNDLLPTYARLQESCMRETPELLAMGVPDRRLATLPGHVARWRADLEARSDQEGWLSQEELGRLTGLQPELIAVCEELESLGPAHTINHGDLHDGNVLWLNRRFRIFDWGDSSLTHPFFSLRTTFVSIENRLGWEEDDPRFNDLRRQYLGGWSSAFESENLERAFELARMVWSIVTALNWEAALGTFATPAAKEYEHVLPSLMRERMEAMER